MRTPPSAGSRLLAGLLVVSSLVVAGVAFGYALGRAEVAALAGGRIPAVAYDAYRTASRLSPTITASCNVEWTVLAAIGQVESRHGRIDEREVTDSGDVVPAIRGRPLDGTRGTEAIPDTDSGHLDGDAEWDRALGPLQFIPTTWRELGRDGNGDGTADPNNLYDASLTAVAHLCLREPGDYADRGQLRQALIAYNASGQYADDVLRWVDRYRGSSPDDVVEAPVDEAEA